MVDEDYQAWIEYPEHRWVFNKLEVALMFGYDAGPACVPITKSGNYIIRPIYNLYGMGIGATIKHLDPDLHGEEMTHHKHIPPGYFWCEAFEGEHKSVDFKNVNGRWVPFCTVIGENDKDNLTRFHSWKKTWNTEYIFSERLQFDGVKNLNIEFIDNNPIEIHLRTGNDAFWGLSVGESLYPVWKDDDIEPDIPNHYSDSFKYAADGHLSDIRVGYSLTNSSK
jgi:hypothetical protein